MDIQNSTEKQLCIAFPNWSILPPRRYRAGSGSLITYPQHDAMLNVEKDLLFLPVVPDEGMQCVTVGDPADEARVG